MAAATAAASQGELAEAWRVLLPHREQLSSDPSLARLWLLLWRDDPAPLEGADALAEIAAAFPDDARLLALVIDGYVKAGAGHDAVDLAKRTLSRTESARLYASAAAAFRFTGADAEAFHALNRAEELDPSQPMSFERGLLHKSRGEHAQALEAFRAAQAHEVNEAALWNIAITATVVGDGRAALDAWLQLGFEAVLGPDSLPAVNGLGRCRVRIFGATPDIHQDSWVHMRSPCHGVVLTPSRLELGADYSDVVVWDGAPLGVFAEGEKKVPLFPFLAKLSTGGAKKYRFVVNDAARLEELARELPDALWISEDLLIVEPEMNFEEARAELDRVLARFPDLKLTLI